MSVRQAHLIAASIVVTVGAVFIIFSLPIYSIKIGGGPGAGVFPFWVGLFVVMCGLAYLWESLRSQASEKFLTTSGQERAWLLQTALSIIAYIALMPYLGFGLASFLLLLFHVRVIGRYRLPFSLLLSAIMAALCAYSFRVWLYIALPRGFLGW